MSAMLAQLRALKEAHAEGLIDDEEFAIAKKEAMSANAGAAPATAAPASAPEPAKRKSPRLAAAAPAVKDEASDDDEDEQDDDEEDQKAAAAAKKADKPKKDKKKKGTGKKPLQDFEVGKSYPGTVVSLTKFGAYIDIGCHSDGLCHISRLSDDYVAKVEDVVKKDQLVICRVTEIDLKGKKLTLSLQSEKMAEREQASAEAKRKRDTEAPKDKPKKPKAARDPNAPPRKKNKRGPEAQARRNAKRLAKKGITI